MAQTAKAKDEGFAVLAALEDFVTAMVRHPGEVKTVGGARLYHGARVSTVVRLRKALRKRLGV